MSEQRREIKVFDLSHSESKPVLADFDEFLLSQWDRDFKKLYGEDPKEVLKEGMAKSAPPPSPKPIETRSLYR
jgi:hypothetical protein